MRAGIEVAKAAADDVKRVHLELGGKAPVIVFDDADLELAAENIAIAGYFNAGQDCTAATRVLAGPKIHDDFVAALGEQARNTRTGPPDDGEVLFGPLNNANQLEQVSGFVDRAPDHANVVAGGHRQGDRGYFYEPTVVDGLRQDDEMIQNEIFGPVITVQTFDDEDKAVEWANGVDVRARLERLDRGPRARDADVAAARLRLRLDQLPHPARRRDAARRLQEVGLRQGPLDVRARGLHARQARHELHRAPRRVSGPPDLGGLPEWVKSLGLPAEAAAAIDRYWKPVWETLGDELSLLPAHPGRQPAAAPQRIEFEARRGAVARRAVARALRGDVADVPHVVPPGRRLRAA